MLIESFNAYHISLHFGVLKYSNNIFPLEKNTWEGIRWFPQNIKEWEILFWIEVLEFILVFILFAKSALIALGKYFQNVLCLSKCSLGSKYYIVILEIFLVFLVINLN